jgi:hypothetical protein
MTFAYALLTAFVFFFYGIPTIVLLYIRWQMFRKKLIDLLLQYYFIENFSYEDALTVYRALVRPGIFFIIIICPGINFLAAIYLQCVYRYLKEHEDAI